MTRNIWDRTVRAARVSPFFTGLVVLVILTVLGLIPLWLTGDLKFSEFLALLVGAVSLPVGLAALRVGRHTDAVLASMANAQFLEKEPILEDLYKTIQGGNNAAAIAMATDVRALSRVASVADDHVKSRMLNKAVLPAIQRLKSARSDPNLPKEVTTATDEIESNAKDWGVKLDGIDEGAGFRSLR